MQGLTKKSGRVVYISPCRHMNVGHLLLIRNKLMVNKQSENMQDLILCEGGGGGGPGRVNMWGKGFIRTRTRIQGVQGSH